MTTVIVNETAGPKLHAFIIGVGSYSYLEDGSAPGAKLPYAMGQLKAAPVSALAIANWLINEYEGPTPLGSIEILVSSTDVPEVVLKNGTKVKIEDRANNEQSIKKAFKRWYRRLNGIQLVDGVEVNPPPAVGAESQENIAFFYFCGHGFEKGNVHLLLEEFGADKELLFENSFNFHNFYRGMKRAKPKTQLYFVDSCRTVPKAATDRDTIEGISLIDSLISDKNEREAPILFSTLSNTTAWAPTDGSATRFTQILISCLNGAASDHDQGVWQVTTGKLVSGMKELLNTDPIKGQICMSEGDRLSEKKVLCLLDQPPVVKLTVECRPKDFLNRVTFKISNSFLNTQHERPEPKSEPWEIEVQAAAYVFEAFVADGSRSIPKEEMYIFPPKKERILDLR